MIFNIQNFSVDDGPGIRTVVFMKGCHLRCYWCHNPESWFAGRTMLFYRHKCIECGKCTIVCPVADYNKGITAKDVFMSGKCSSCGHCAATCSTGAFEQCGYELDSKKLLEILVKDKELYDISGGGVTFSGGEPLLQADFLLKMLNGLKKAGIHVAVETSCCVSPRIVFETIGRIDLFICDIKHMDPVRHEAATGQDNKKILENIRLLSSMDANMIIRVPVIPGFNDNIESMLEIARYVKSLKNKHLVELLPFHGICIGKYEAMGLDYEAKHLKTPKKEAMEALVEVYREQGIECRRR